MRRRQLRLKADRGPQGRRHGHDHRLRLVHLARGGVHFSAVGALLDAHHRIAQLQRLGVAALQLGCQQGRHLAGTAAHQPGFWALALWGHRLGPGQMQDRGLPGFKAARAPHAAEPVERQAGQGQGGVLRRPGVHAEAIEPFGIRAQPGLARVDLSHQRRIGPLQRHGGR